MTTIGTSARIISMTSGPHPLGRHHVRGPAGDSAHRCVHLTGANLRVGRSTIWFLPAHSTGFLPPLLEQMKNRVPRPRFGTKEVNLCDVLRVLPKRSSLGSLHLFDLGSTLD